MIRKAVLKDVKEIQQLIKLYSNRGEMLPRSLSELYDNIRDFFVAVRNRRVVGICALMSAGRTLQRSGPWQWKKRPAGKESGLNWQRPALKSRRSSGLSGCLP